MPLEAVVFIEDFTASWPTGTDPKNEGDNHLRNIKTGVLGSFPNTTGAWNTTDQIKMGGADMKSAKVINVGDPTDPKDGANLDAVTTRVQGFISWGAVGSDGSSANTPGSGDWNSSRLATGVYLIGFTRAVTGTGSQNTGVSVCPFGDGDDLTATFIQNPDRTTLQVYLQKNGNPQDGVFSFIRMVA